MKRALFTLALALSGAGCPGPGSTPSGPAPVSADVVSTVNGVGITRQQLELRLKATGHEAPEVADKARALDALVAQELEAQEAVKLGLAQTAGFLEFEAQLQAQVAEARRRELARLYQAHLVSAVKISDADVDALKAAEAKHLAEDVRVSQLLFKSKAQAEEALAAVRSSSFDEVARKQFQPLPAGLEPWKLEFLSWQQVPTAWWPALDALAPGQVSGVISGPNERHWVLRLDERRPSQASPEAVRAALTSVLRAQRLEENRNKSTSDLRARAVIK
ncbi:MAG: peptidyl-prolyl cis-trans isomerase [Myxococcota bacterium]